VTREQRSRMMSGIRGKNTGPELIIRKLLHARGFRYRLHDVRLPGKPDIIFPKYKAAIQVQGCFWHRHHCHLFKWPQTRKEFWKKKISGNVANDHKKLTSLLESGWRVGIVWECAIKGRTRMSRDVAIEKLAEWLMSDHKTIEVQGLAG